MVKSIGDVLISQGIIERDGGDAEEEAGPVSESPLHSVLGEDAHQLEFFALGDVEQFFRDDATADVVGLGDGLLVCEVLDDRLIALLDYLA